MKRPKHNYTYRVFCRRVTCRSRLVLVKLTSSDSFTRNLIGHFSVSPLGVEFVDVAVRLSAEDLQLRLRQFRLHLALRALKHVFQRTRRLAQLQIRFAVDVGRLDVADAVRFARVEHHDVAGNLFVLLYLL